MNDLPSSYAQALFSLCKDKATRKAYAEVLKSLRDLFKQEKDVMVFLSSPDFSEEEKMSVLQKTLQNQDKLTHLLPFMRTVISHHRISSFSRIVDAYVSLVNEELGILEGYVYSSSKLTPAQLDALQKGFYKKLGKEVVLKNILDPTLLGGVRVALNGKVYDSSVKGRLEELHHHLNQGGNSL